ncbi:hypothetical protein ACQP1K_27145 [Sphaerimonospora sp. CA-214678]|uniref:hypothetical protein n=1 Tax=Sphaerimonospora sp. CA-214678 TaxID=3240029 RepID=UPI003D9407C9
MSGVAVLACALLAPTPANAAIGDPVAAVRRLLAAQLTAKVTEVGNVSLSSRMRVVNHTAKSFQYTFKRAGSIQLGRKGVVASDLSRRLHFERRDSADILKDDAANGDPVAKSLLAQTRPHRSVSVNGRLYTTGSLYAPALPEGKTWALRGAVASGGAFTDQVVNIFEPKTLKTLLSDTYFKKLIPGHRDSAGREHKNVMLYKGKITFADLYAVSPTFQALAGQQPDATLAPAFVWWWLWTDKNGKPLRFASTWDTWVSGKVHQPPRARGSAMTDYLTWRPRITIKMPKSSLVARVKGPANSLPEFDDAMEAIRDRRP